MKFITNNVDTSLIKKDYDFDHGSFTIHWELDIEMRDWGIKDIYCFINKITGSYIESEWDVEDPVWSDDIDFEVDGDSNEWEIDNDVKFSDGTFYPSCIDIDFNQKTILVT